jgi:hypothetical protein
MMAGKKRRDEMRIRILMRRRGEYLRFSALNEDISSAGAMRVRLLVANVIHRLGHSDLHRVDR